MGVGGRSPTPRSIKTRNQDPISEALIQNNAASEIVRRVEAALHRSRMLQRPLDITKVARRECRFYCSHAAPDRQAALYVSKRVCRMLELKPLYVVVTAVQAYESAQQ